MVGRLLIVDNPIKKMRTTTALIFLFFCLKGKTQSLPDDHLGKNIRMNLFAGISRATFESNPSAPSKFPTAEFRLGVGINKPISKVIELRSRLTIGTRLKRESIGQLVVYSRLDEVASNRNHYFYEMPVLIQFNLPHPKLGLNIGINYRFFFPNNEQVDLLTGRGEIGIITGITFLHFSKFDLGIDYYMGITEVFSATYVGPTSIDRFSATNNFMTLRVEYKLKK